MIVATGAACQPGRAVAGRQGWLPDGTLAEAAGS